jgi:site-specific recombinase XerD
MKFYEAHQNFLKYLEVIKNKSDKTIEQYDRHLKKFEDFLEEENIDSYNFPVEKITLKLADNFREFLYNSAKKRISIKTANAYMITLRSFLKYLEKK